MSSKCCGLLFLCWAIVFTTVSNVQGGLFCPDGSHLYSEEQVCIKLHTQKKRSWQGASDVCRNHGGSLITIKSQTKLNLMKDLQSDETVNAWIGLKTLKSDDTSSFAWEGDSKKTIFANWDKDEPKRRKDNDCASLGDKDAKWSSNNCRAKMSYFCETPAFHNAPIECPAGWFMQEGQDAKCYRLFTDKKEWGHAREACLVQNGELATVSHDNNRMLKFIHSEYHYDNGAIWIQSAGRPSVDSDQTGDTTDDKVGGVSNGEQICVQMSISAQKIKYEDSPLCSDKKVFLCQKEPNNADVHCDDGWDLNFDYKTCLKRFNQGANWDTARSACKQVGGDLVKIPDKQYDTYVRERLFKTQKYYWIGIRGKDHEPLWLDETKKATYVRFGGQSPRYEECGYTTTKGSWQWKQCSSKLYYVCQKSPFASITCPNGYNPYLGGETCIKLSTDAQPWEIARKSCQADGGDLLAVKDVNTAKFVKGLVDKNKAAYWIGLHDRQKNNIFQWLDKTDEPQYLSWGEGQPNDDGTRNCAQINGAGDGNWVDNSCAIPNKYICQHPATVKGIKPETKKGKGICREGWTKYEKENTCFKYYNEEKAWEDARVACKNEQGDLIKIEDDDFSKFVSSSLQKKLPYKTEEAQYYIGINDIQKPNRYMWLDGTQDALYHKWLNGKPRTEGGRCGVLIVKQKSINSMWQDVKCTVKNNYICQADALPAESLGCGDGWVKSIDDDYCYKFNTELLNWHDAKGSCNVNGGDLVSLPTSNEMFNIMGTMLMNKKNETYWTGGNKIEPDRGWMWSDNKPFAFLNWESGEPERNASADCIALHGRLGQWKAVSCLGHIPSICKKKAIPDNLPTPMPTSTSITVPDGMVFGCPNHWYEYKDSCIGIYNDTDGVEWKEGNKACHRMGSSLATIRDEDESNFLNSLLPLDVAHWGNSWIGLSNFASKSSLTWSDSMTSVTHTNWDVDQPYFDGTEQVCGQVSFKNGRWDLAPCTKSNMFTFCKQKKSLMKEGDVSIDKSCKKGGKGYQDKCYIYHHVGKSFQKAQKNCQSIGAVLVTVNDRFIQAFISTYITSEIWIGLSNTKKATTGDDEGNYVYSWASGATISFTHWDRDHTGQEKGTCVSMLGNPIKGLWHNSVCDDSNAYVCEYPRPGYPTPKPMTTVPNLLPCPSDWIAFENMCYKPITDFGLVNWMEAKSACEGIITGGTLASVTSKELSHALLDEIKRLSIGGYWIGLSDRHLEGAHSWVDGKPFIYQDWKIGEPSNGDKREDCVNIEVTYRGTSGWNDRHCYSPLDNFICQAPRGAQVITTLAPPTGATDPQCGSKNWKLYCGYCYKYLTIRRESWHDARSACNKVGAELASILDEDENGFITTLKGRRDNFVWIGLNDLEGDVYKWTDGTPLNFIAWGKGEPDDGNKGERCAEMGYDGVWFDQDCHKKRFPICKKKLPISGSQQPITLPPPTPPTGGCAASFYGVPGTSMCYYLGGRNPTDRKSFADAAKACKAVYEKSRLASIHFPLDQAFIMTLIADLSVQAWIGLKASNNYGKESFKWVDNTKTDDVYWAPYRPRHTVTKTCVNMMINPKYAGQWENVDCDEKLAYVCQYRKDDTYPTNAPNTEGCPSGYRRYKDSCYKYISKLQTWSNSEVTCAKDGGHLVWLNSLFDTAFVKVYLDPEKVPSTWIGLSDNSHLETYSWSNGWPVMYTAWGKDQPDLKKHCVFLNHDWTWVTSDCGNLLPSICEISLSPLPPTSSVKGKCPDGKWILYDEQCYHVEAKQRATWTEADKICEMLDGDLVSIHSHNEMKFISNHLHQDRVDVWIGLHKTVSGSYKWSDLSEVEYYNWAAGSPLITNEKALESCALSQGFDGKWADSSCDIKHGFVCKRPQTPLYTSSSTTTTTTTTTRTTTKTTKVSTATDKIPNPTDKVTSQTETPYKKTFTQPTTMETATHLKDKQSANSNDPDVGPGEVAGIVIGVIAVIGIGVVLYIVFVRRRYGSSRASSVAGFDNALFKNSQGSDQDEDCNIEFHKTTNG